MKNIIPALVITKGEHESTIITKKERSIAIFVPDSLSCERDDKIEDIGLKQGQQTAAHSQVNQEDRQLRQRVPCLVSDVKRIRKNKDT
ncbi:hypothetical protein [Alteribacillus sp. YIM 98480]|uniref:hypothetical protein n=1 Tax=Alteribacillus sp. YIM 98480 TaxID=2606599 RepID=UPI00131A7547|nr:hypothetical protein [Alteribacillus sp. YIM 98480]